MKYFVGTVILVMLLSYECAQPPKIDFCSFDITNNLAGRAYPIDHLPEMVGPVFKEEFEARIKEDDFKSKFIETFGSTMNEVSEWYYSFEQLGRIDVNRVLPESLHCVFVFEREYYPHGLYWQPALDKTSIINYLVNAVFEQAKNEDLTDVRLPLLVFNVSDAIACNFGKMFSAGEEYFVLHCVHNIMDGGTAMTTKIMHKLSKIQMCDSSAPEVCNRYQDQNLQPRMY